MPAPHHPIELRGVTAGYDGAVVLRDVSLVLPERSCLAVIGPNGAGKTTLMRVLSGLVVPTDGALVLEGDDCTGQSPHHLATRGVCHVTEGRSVFPSLSVKDNLRLFGRLAPDDDLEGLTVEVFPSLAGKMDQLAGTLSGGEQQMLALTRAYAQSSRVVLLDEVSMGLAPRIVDEIFEFLHRLTARGTSLVLVEQYITKALALADYALILVKGSVRFWGEPRELSGQDVFAQYLGVPLHDMTKLGEKSLA